MDILRRSNSETTSATLVFQIHILISYQHILLINLEKGTKRQNWDVAILRMLPMNSILASETGDLKTFFQ